MDGQQSMDDLKDILQQWVGRRVLITKEENDDIDQTVIDLERYNQEAYEGTDDYLSNKALQLIGSGETVGAKGNAPLPYSSFDLPIGNVSEIHCDIEGVFMRTDQAVYTITPV